MIVALTGATGFVGKAVVDQALAQGQHVRALTRRAQPDRTGVTWAEGSLEDPASLSRLVTGADAVLHVAGVVSGSRDAFQRGNVEGTRAMLAAATAAGVSRFVHVSSLAAREPELSQYGRSKAQAEAEVRRSGLAWTMVQPPGVYGPGDMDMRDLFRMAKRGIALLPPPGRLSLIHVADLAGLLVTLVEQDPGPAIYECDDGHDGGYSHREFARLIGRAVGRRLLPISVPAPLLRLAAHADDLIRGKAAKLTLDRAAYFSHPDWTVRPDRRPPAALWQPGIATPNGLAETAAWYRRNGLL